MCDQNTGEQKISPTPWRKFTLEYQIKLTSWMSEEALWFFFWFSFLYQICTRIQSWWYSLMFLLLQIGLRCITSEDVSFLNSWFKISEVVFLGSVHCGVQWILTVFLLITDLWDYPIAFTKHSCLNSSSCPGLYIGEHVHAVPVWLTLCWKGSHTLSCCHLIWGGRKRKYLRVMLSTSSCEGLDKSYISVFCF